MKKADPVEQLVNDIRLMDSGLHEIVQGVRRIVKLEAPDATEIVKYGGIMFQTQAPFCGVFSYQRHVSLEFGRGSQLEDAHGVLEGDGKFRRHIKLNTPADLAGRHVAYYVKQALKLSGRTASAARPGKIEH